MSDDEPQPIPADQLVGMLAEALDEAMFRSHDIHRAKHYDDRDWTKCITSTLCREVAGLMARPEIQLALTVHEATGRDS